jgi:hypothetical protein
VARCTGLGIPDSSGSAQFVIGEFLILKDRPARLDRPKKSTTISQAWVRSFLAIVFFLIFMHGRPIFCTLQFPLAF